MTKETGSSSWAGRGFSLCIHGRPASRIWC